MNNDEYVKALYAINERALSTLEMASHEGLLALERLLDNDKVKKRDIFDYGLRFVVDGTDVELIDKILLNIIKQEKDELQFKLKTVEKEAILGIQKGENPRILIALMNSHTEFSLNDQVFQNVFGD